MLGVQRRVEHLLDLRLRHRLAAYPDAGEKHLLVQPQTTTPDQDQPGDRRDTRLRQTLDDDRGHPVHRRLDAE